jgi:hypothetical protein
MLHRMNDRDTALEDDDPDDDRSQQHETSEARQQPAEQIDPVGRTPPAARPWWKRILGG